MPDNKPDNKCAGGCGNSVTSMNTCKNCLKYIHPGCAMKHKCQCLPDDILTLIKQLQASVDTISNELKEQRIDIKSVLNEVKQLQNENADLKKQVNNLNDRILVLESHSPENDAYDEIEDRIRRSTNVILFNLPESSSENTPAQRKNDDLSRCSEHITDCNEIVSCWRLGKYRAQSVRPLKIAFSSQQKAKQALKTFRTPGNTKLYLRPDLTPKQQNYCKLVRTDFITRKNNGETDITLKYFNGLPKIIKTSEDKHPKNSKNSVTGKA